MPLLWHYLLTQYLKVFAVCVASFVGILLTLRLDEIAYFATLGPDAIKVLWFALQQIPYVLPIAMPVSALISSILLVQSLSQAKELTAMRSCGLALKDILAPILAAALLLSTLNFFITSELSTTSHHSTGQLKNQLRSINPLLLLNNKLLMRIKGAYFDTFGSSRVGEFAQDLVFLSPNKHSDRLTFIAAKRFEVSPERLLGTHVTLISSHPSSKEIPGTEGMPEERLLIENMASSVTSLQEFSHLLEKKIWTINNDHLTFRQLLVRSDETRQHLEELIEKHSSTDEIKEARYDYYRTLSEMMRRFSAALAVFSFTLMGLAFGIQISRYRSNISIFYVVLLATIFLVSFFTAKSFDRAIIAATLLYLLPHLFICLASLWNLRKISNGIE